MYFIPTVTGRLNCSPVRPSNKIDCPDVSKPARVNISLTSASFAPSNTGVAIGTPLVTLPAASKKLSFGISFKTSS